MSQDNETIERLRLKLRIAYVSLVGNVAGAVMSFALAYALWKGLVVVTVGVLP